MKIDDFVRGAELHFVGLFRNVNVPDGQDQEGKKTLNCLRLNNGLAL